MNEVTITECPRCMRGTMAYTWDALEPYWRCIQCGHHVDLHPVEPLPWNPWKDRKRRG